MQSLDVISVNLWNILISLANLVILFLLINKFLYKPVKRILEKRQNVLEERYTSAENAEQQALENKEKWEETLSGANARADEIIKDAKDKAVMRADGIVNDAQSRADGIIRQAEQEAQLERRKAVDEIKREIVEVSSAISEKLLEREINADDHKALIDSFIEEIGDGDD